MKRVISLLLVLVMVLSMTACGECDHKWKDASCEDPKTCSKCGETKGRPKKDHDWEEDDGEMVCSWCDEECDHEFVDNVCEICGLVSAEDEETRMIVVRVPDDWGNPRLWAWNSVTGEDLYDAWPGELMEPYGEYYIIHVPASINYLVVNGLDGAVQTGDIWLDEEWTAFVVVSADGSYSQLFYNEPSEEVFVQMGY